MAKTKKMTVAKKVIKSNELEQAKVEFNDFFIKGLKMNTAT